MAFPKRFTLIGAAVEDAVKVPPLTAPTTTGASLTPTTEKIAVAGVEAEDQGPGELALRGGTEALGARAVFVGRPVHWGLAVGGEAGVARILELIGAELSNSFGFGGTNATIVMKRLEA